jgi:peptidoglycan glycosyltransferase
MENEVLNGTADLFTADRLLEMFTGKKAQGGNVLLTLRKQVQETAYNALLNNKTSSKVGAVVAIDPQSGAILGLVSTPSYDPNPLVQHDFDAAKAAFDQLEKDPGKPLLNRALSETFPARFDVQGDRSPPRRPCRTASPPTPCSPAATATPPRTPRRRSATARRDLRQPDQAAGRAARLVQHGILPARGGAAGSGQGQGGLAGVRLREHARDRPGRGQRAAGGDEPHRDMKSPDGSIDRPALAQSCIGQREVRWTPLQGALVAAAIANNGSQMRPYLNRHIQDANLAPIWKADPKVARQPVSSGVAGQLRQMMEAVVANGNRHERPH